MKNKDEDLNTIYSIHEAFASGRWEYTAIAYEVEWEDNTEAVSNDSESSKDIKQD